MPDPPDLTGNLSAPDDLSGLGDAPPTQTPPVQPPSSSHDIFFGSEGLRAGWGLLVYMTLLFVLAVGTGSLVAKLGDTLAQPESLLGPKLVYESEGVSLLCVIFATWVMAKIERRPTSSFGLRRPRWLPNFLAGLGWGAAMLSLLVLSLHTAGLLIFDARLLFGRSAFHYGAVWLGGFLLVGLLEEYLFRGYLQLTLARGLNGICEWLRIPRREALGFWAAAVLLSFGFGLTHRSNAGESPIGLLAAGLIGLVFCLSLWRTGSLWWAIGFHASWDWAQSFLYGVADSGHMVAGHLFATHPAGRPILSGGLTGPEGSILILPILALTTAVILLTLPNTRAADTPRPDPI